ncbi:iron complex outermembrane receptor protein [Paraburkholderia tropica]|uniref:TonB-dependent siderophore receptor n=1 Tax=Paraburkholderia tropica TaxID=92647 RepID=UPI0017BE09FF|nr:TonB-dependent receptor [Paraburkholderia tropica]MBB2999126.1 iron complex outermembrane receptor protein [Paraburkholderia tropica]MBB6318974.1 iron complex outermembrane receptor protein [Paraburkholderia tropica]
MGARTSLSAALLVSAGVTLSTLSTAGWAQAIAQTETQPATQSDNTGDAVTGDAADGKALPAVKVNAARDSETASPKRVTAGALGNRRQVDTPFSTDVVTTERGKDLLANTANDLFKYDPAVTVVGDNATGENSAFAIRGLAVDMLNGVKVDGQNFPSWDTELSLEQFEQVEVLKGLSGFMYGFSTPGGIVNYVLKRPTDDPYRSFSIGYQSAGVFSEKIDLGGRFGNDKRFGYRLNLVNEDGNTAEANGHVRRQVASLALDFRITPDLTWTADAFYQKRKTNGTLFGIYVGGGLGIPDAGKVTRDLTQPQNFYETEIASFGTGLDYRISDTWRASLKYRFAKENRTNSDSLLYVYNAAGDYQNTLYAALTRYFYQNVDAMVQGKFNTGPFKHDVVIGASYQTQQSEYDDSEGWNDGYSLGTGNLYQSTLLTNDAVHIGENLFRHERTTQTALYASDTVQITPRLSALLGLRYTQFRDRVYNVDQSVQADYSANPVTPTGALMFKLDPDTTVYASYVEALQQGGASSNTNVNYPQTFGPLKSKQYEVGLKADHRNWGANLALFRIDQGYEYTNSANVFTQSGTKRYQGIDASGWLQLAADWRLMGGVMWLNAKAVDVDDASVDGKRIYGAPRFTVTGRVEYNPSYLRALTVAFGGKYVGNMAVDAANTQFVPAYTTWDLSAKYETQVAGKDVTLRAGVNNLFNRRYWTAAWGYYVMPSATRTFVANATLEF